MKYLFRLDDACETMNWERWLKMEALLDKYNIKPLIAVIPNNADPGQKIDPPRETFWQWVKNLEQKGWEIGLHGNNHVFQTKEGGINPIHSRSEFAGVPLTEQKNKIKKGVEKLKSEGLNPRIFVAPGHTFDLNTLKALKAESDINIVSDTMGFMPYKKHDFVFIPQQLGQARNVFLPGIFTMCYHPHGMNDKAFYNLEQFLIKNKNKFLSFQELNLSQVKPKTIISKLLSFSYFQFRKMRK
ncbi:DUF2334 domain-containing protein [Sabulilitoribacter arenilitoris]|uniref:DUF2334 domain-containing protein n=1 Tax=Wocania arenilitoris TaxID=2044858 RepID=A0AAE3JLT1_9FLAO|nr:DUF2334 domain-containing protein [Wocania arenilitoris]MCF7568644.1 DUF2334 domain-containing protein [Wocania arenilitoris]